jgi:hypothetical protein
MDGEPKKPSVPGDLSAPGLIYRLRRRGWVVSWSPRSDLTARGYQGKTVRLWPGDSVPLQQSEPTRAEWEVISAWCVRYNAEQLKWACGGVEDDPQSLFDGTIAGLVRVYEKHKKSPLKKLRYEASMTYDGRLRTLAEAIGKVRVTSITFDNLSDWQDEFARDEDGGKPKKSRAAALIWQLKAIITFGCLVLPASSGCPAVRQIFAVMAEAKMMGGGSRRRTEYMTAAQCRLLCMTAHAMGHHSVALEQAFAFELGLRQKDMIGEWVSRAWPGITDVAWGPRKWLMGLRWEEIDDTLILRHRLSKSVRGREAVMDAEAGKTKAWDLAACPMVMDELRRVAGKDGFTRADLPASGPLIICERRYGGERRPWTASAFRDTFRRIRKQAGLPASVQNRDSRPGAATEATAAGAPRDKVQRGLGHAKGATTEIYIRDEIDAHRELARLRTDKRKP